MKKNKLTPADKKILELLGYIRTEEDGAQFEHPYICNHTTFPQYVWKGDTLKDVLKNFTEGVRYGTMSELASMINNKRHKLDYYTKNN